jgi:hypothetical protein
MSEQGRAAYVQMAMMFSLVIYQLMAVDLEPWVLQLIDKLSGRRKLAGATVWWPRIPCASPNRSVGLASIT